MKYKVFIDRSKCTFDVARECEQPCRKYCFQEVFAWNEERIVLISGRECNGCGVCVEQCPAKALKIVSLP